MARQLRIEFPGALYHVMSRGNERNPIVKSDADRILFIDTLKDSAEISGVKVLAYVLMDNHYHMIINNLVIRFITTTTKSLGLSL